MVGIGLTVYAGSCRTGGPGSSSCEYSYSILFGLISETYSVSCGGCSYACCTIDNASCITQYSDDPSSSCHPNSLKEPAQ